MLSAWLPWILGAAVIVIGIPLLCWHAGDEPRNDEPPDSCGDEDPGRAVLPAAA